MTGVSLTFVFQCVGSRLETIRQTVELAPGTYTGLRYDLDTEACLFGIMGDGEAADCVTLDDLFLSENNSLVSLAAIPLVFLQGFGRLKLNTIHPEQPFRFGVTNHATYPVKLSVELQFETVTSRQTPRAKAG